MSSPESETRTRILEKTWQLMEKRRGQGVRLDDVAKSAGVSRQAVYLHFRSRAELLIATARHVDEVRGLHARLQELAAVSGGPEVLEAFVDFWGNYIPEIHGLAKALLAVRETDKAAAAAWDDRMDALRQGCRATIQCLVRSHVLNPQWKPDQAADALWAMTSIQVWENLTADCGWSNGEYISRMKTLLKLTFLKPA